MHNFSNPWIKFFGIAIFLKDSRDLFVTWVNRRRYL